MEVVRLSGYTATEKLEIANRHLVPKLVEEHGLTPARIRFTDTGLRRIIADYTREAGLRNLEREIAAVCRKVAVRVAEGDKRKVTINPKKVGELLGSPRHRAEELLRRDRIGVATGLAWTGAGGDLLFIEVVALPGKGKLLLTGQLGEVMRESAQAAVSFARAWAADHDYDAAFFSDNDLHIHVPAGSIPKDGPSAGITIATAILSVLTRRPVSRQVAMTGEITLRGTVLPIGGLKEKVLAAKMAGIERIVVPDLNRTDVDELDAGIREGLTFVPVEHMDAVLDCALLPIAAPKRRRGTAAGSGSARSKGRARKTPRSSPVHRSSEEREPS
jgi:ATP-dependent Lon protease